MGAGTGKNKRIMNSSANQSLVDQEHLKEVASTIRHCGDYGNLFYHPQTSSVWWTAGDADGEGYTPPEEIDRRFSGVPGVKKVIILTEDGPTEEAELTFFEQEGVLQPEEAVSKRSVSVYDYGTDDWSEIEIPVRGWDKITYPMYPINSLLAKTAPVTRELREQFESCGEFMTDFYIHEETGCVAVLLKQAELISSQLKEETKQRIGEIDGIVSVKIVENIELSVAENYHVDEAWISLW